MDIDRKSPAAEKKPADDESDEDDEEEEEDVWVSHSSCLLGFVD